MKTSQLVAIGFMTAACGLFASSASAQDVRQPDMSIGYLNVMGTMHGGNAQVALPLSPHVGLVGEFDMSKGRDCGDCNDHVYHDMAALGGVRFTWFGDRRVSPFSQVLIGGLHSRASGYDAEYGFGLGRRYQPGFTVDYGALQPGAGLTLRVNQRLAFRAQTDVQFGFADQNQFEGVSLFPRTVAAVVVRLGK